nr:MAG TPA: hypothetical protein [Caudoviricetes sp.]
MIYTRPLFSAMLWTYRILLQTLSLCTMYDKLILFLSLCCKANNWPT